ncbi:MAG: response regulator, partial [Ferruginibacter sp.]|nr:response regulator [Chitinophagaceae bacterium]
MICIVIEDEPLSANVLKEHIQEVPFLELKEVFHDAIAAMNFLGTNPVDLLFLDIHLPKLKGLDFLRSFNFPGQVIITSAHHEYALEGYELSIVDYLLKPISFERFLKAVQKAHELFTYKNLYKNYETHISTNTGDEVIFFKSG